MFGKKDNQANDRVIYTAKPNIILGCKKAFLGLILLIIVILASGAIIKFMGGLEVYLISQIKLPITRYIAIAIFVVMLIICLYIIWQIVGWYSKEYIFTDSKIIVKSGIILTHKNYMPYSTIQDIDTSQSILARLFNVGSISVYSAYDNNQVALENVSNPSKIEEIIFSNMSRGRPYYQDPRDSYYKYNNPQQNQYYDSRQNFNNNYRDSQQNYYPNSQRGFDDYYQDDYDDDTVVITPITHEEQYQRRQYDYYPEDLDYNNVQKPKYEYEPYNENLEHNINRAMGDESGFYNDSPNNYQNNSHYNEEIDDNSYADDYYYHENERKSSFNDYTKKDSNAEKDDVESSEKVIKRHFDKFKR